MTTKVETGSLTALFHDLVQDAMEQQQIASTETTEYYLVHLLERFAAPGRPDLDSPPAAVPPRLSGIDVRIPACTATAFCCAPAFEAARLASQLVANGHDAVRWAFAGRGADASVA